MFKAVIAWLEEHWHLAGAVCAVILLALLPVFTALGAGALALVYLQLPLYQIHQMEEHHGDRLRREINRTFGRGHEALTPRAVLVANLVGVWAVMVVGLYLAAFVQLSLGLIAMYLPPVNAVTHVAAAVAFRAYNPGLATALLLFLGVGVPSLIGLADASDADVTAHALGLAVAIGAHVILLIHLRRRLRALQSPR